LRRRVPPKRSYCWIESSSAARPPGLRWARWLWPGTRAGVQGQWGPNGQLPYALIQNRRPASPFALVNAGARRPRLVVDASQKSCELRGGARRRRAPLGIVREVGVDQIASRRASFIDFRPVCRRPNCLLGWHCRRRLEVGEPECRDWGSSSLAWGNVAGGCRATALPARTRRGSSGQQWTEVRGRLSAAERHRREAVHCQTADSFLGNWAKGVGERDAPTPRRQDYPGWQIRAGAPAQKFDSSRGMLCLSFQNSA